MDVNSILDTSAGPSQELMITGAMRENLRISARWAKFIALTLIIIATLGLLLSLVLMGSAMSRELGLSPIGAAGAGGGLYLFFSIVTLVIFYAVSWYHYQFGVKTQRALRANDQQGLADAFQNLQTYYQIAGITFAVFVGLYVIIFIFGIMVALLS